MGNAEPAARRLEYAWCELRFVLVNLGVYHTH